MAKKAGHDYGGAPRSIERDRARVSSELPETHAAARRSESPRRCTTRPGDVPLPPTDRPRLRSALGPGSSDFRVPALVVHQVRPHDGQLQRRPRGQSRPRVRRSSRPVDAERKASALVTAFLHTADIPRHLRRIPGKEAAGARVLQERAGPRLRGSSRARCEVRRNLHGQS